MVKNQSFVTTWKSLLSDTTSENNIDTLENNA